MKGLVLSLVLVILSVSVINTQKTPVAFDPDNKLFIITLDGFRWQEVFNGADSSLLFNAELTPDTLVAQSLYWHHDDEIRRRRLMPFLWSVVSEKGQIYGNREYGNNVNVSNPYALSYPGYNELLTGGVDFSITGNDRKKNRNKNVLEELNNTRSYAGKIAAFTSWDMFPYILNKERNGLMINSGLQNVEGKRLSSSEKMINTIQSEMVHEPGETRYDQLTYIACREYVMKNKPSVVFLSFSGTDDAGHDKRYDLYLQEANNADKMIGELWRLVQSMPEYAGRTTFLITTDHGRGSKGSNWHKHGFFVGGSSQTWYAVMGPSVVPNGEMKISNQVYQKQLHSLIKETLAR
jgi:hypothetical protein